MSPRITRLLELLARAGYAARGFVYVSIGLLTLGAVLGLTPKAAGTGDVIQMLSGWPFGRVWLTGIAAGLAGFAIWRGLQSVLDADRQGTKPAAMAGRAGQAVSGVIYGGLALSLYRALDAVEDAIEATGGEGAQASAARVLDLPLGGALLMLAGVFVVGVGIAGLVRAVREDFCRRLGCGRRIRRVATWLGRAGYAGRGVAFLPLGFFIVLAGRAERAAEARGLGETLQAIEAQPFGQALLALISLGLLAFGLYAFVEARYRRIDVPNPG